MKGVAVAKTRVRSTFVVKLVVVDDMAVGWTSRWNVSGLLVRLEVKQTEKEKEADSPATLSEECQH